MNRAAPTMDKSSEAPALAAPGGALLVEANGRTFAISAADVHSIVRVGSVAETPSGPEFLIGFTSVKGAILPVLSLGRRIDPKGCRGAASPFVVVLEAIGRIAAFSVDRIGAVVPAAAGDVLPAPHALEMAMAPFTTALLRCEGALAPILDAGMLLNYPLGETTDAVRAARLN